MHAKMKTGSSRRGRNDQEWHDVSSLARVRIWADMIVAH